jgi:gluconolactonase
MYGARIEAIGSEVFTELPARFRRDGERSEWADANRGGQAVASFLEGPSFDRAGNLWVTDIPFGRIFRISPAGEWTLVAEYDGWPNGLKIHRDGRIFVTDYRRGIVVVDPATGRVSPFLASRYSEGFLGVNDLVFASNADLYFTDQGQTGLHDPRGRVYRYTADGRLTCLIDTVPSPNGIVLAPDEKALFVAVTRGNAVWRGPLQADGALTKVGAFAHLFGPSGPDGLAMDEEGSLAVAHAGQGCVWLFDRKGVPTHRVVSCRGDFVTNVAYGGPDRRTLYMTESQTGSILVATMPVAGRTMYSHR